jgi:hypothetical protein
MKFNFIFFCKSFKGDLHRLKILVNSFNEFNIENLKLVISIPKSDLPYFNITLNENINLITDESYTLSHLTNYDYKGTKAGYINQEICKLTFWKTDIALNYFCLDSDSQFIRPFSISDFMYNDVTPYTVLVQDKDLSLDKYYRKKFWIDRYATVKKIYNEINHKDNRYRTCHGHQTFNSLVLKSLENDFMIPRGYNYLDLIKIAPLEFTWYNVWFQKCKIVEEIACEPIFKTIHTRREYFFGKLQLLYLNDFANEYVGIVLNSKWKPKTPLKYNNPNFLYIFLHYILTLRIWLFNELRGLISIYIIQPLKHLYNNVFK